MLSSGANLKWSQDGKEIHFICDSDTSIAIAKEALFQFQTHMGRIEEAAKIQAAEATKTSDKESEEKEKKSLSQEIKED